MYVAGIFFVYFLAHSLSFYLVSHPQIQPSIVPARALLLSVLSVPLTATRPDCWLAVPCSVGFKEVNNLGLRTLFKGGQRKCNALLFLLLWIDLWPPQNRLHVTPSALPRDSIPLSPFQLCCLLGFREGRSSATPSCSLHLPALNGYKWR